MVNIRTSSVYLFIVFITFFGLLGKVQSDIVYSDPIDIHELNCTNEIITFDNLSITFNQTVFNIHGNCTLKSQVGLFQVPIFIINTDPTLVNKLILDEVVFSINSNVVINDFLIEMGSSSSFHVNYNVTINYFAVQSNSQIFTGGEIVIGDMATTVTLKIKLVLNSAAETNFTVASSITNFNIFEVNGILLGLNVNQYFAKTYSVNFFNSGLFSTVPSGNLLFTSVSAQIVKGLNLQGGKLLLNDTDLYTKNIDQYSFFYNTSVEITNLSSIILYRNNNTLISGIRLESGSNLKLIGATALGLQLFSLINVYQSVNTDNIIYSSENLISCDNFEPKMSFTFKKFGATSVIRLGSVNMCSNRAFSSLIYPNTNWVANNTVNGCPPDKYACKGRSQCVPLSESCTGATCSDGVTPLQARDLKEVNDIIPVGPSCWNGECTLLGYGACPGYPACPPNLPLRCAGKCTSDEACGDERDCVTKCVDGCYNETRECQPFFGCPLYHYQCPDNNCVPHKDLCNNDTITLPYSNRFVESKAAVYPQTMDTATIPFRVGNYGNNIVPNADITLNSNNISTPTDSKGNYLTIKPIADSHAIKLNASKINSNFDYYKHLLTAPFTIQLNNEISTNFSEPATFYFSIPQVQDLSNKSFCLAFENSQGEWECTPYQPELANNNTGAFLKTTHFTNFALILTYKDDGTTGSTSSQESSADSKTKIFSNKKTLAIAVSLSVVGAVAIAVGVGAFVAFKLKYTSLRRWKVSRDLEREASRSRMSSSTSSLNSELTSSK